MPEQRKLVLTSGTMQVRTDVQHRYFDKGHKSASIPVSGGWERAFLHMQQLSTLKRIVLFLLQEQVVANPDMFVGFEALRDRDGSMGREILLNTLFHESLQVIEMAYEIVSRVQFEDAVVRKKKANQASFTKSATADEASGSVAVAVAVAADNVDVVSPDDAKKAYTEFVYINTLEKLRRLARTDSHATAIQPKFEPLPHTKADYEPVTLHGKMSALQNDQTVYVSHPVRIVNGVWDHSVNDVQPLCGRTISRFFEQSSKAEGADVADYDNDRQELARTRRELCLFDSNDLDVDNLVRHRLDQAFYEKPMPDNAAAVEARVEKAVAAAALKKKERESAAADATGADSDSATTVTSADA